MILPCVFCVRPPVFGRVICVCIFTLTNIKLHVDLRMSRWTKLYLSITKKYTSSTS